MPADTSSDDVKGLLIAWSQGDRAALDEACVFAEERAAELVELDDSLTALARVDERKSRWMELRYFGLRVDEAAEALGVPPDTVTREWQRTKIFLRRELEAGEGGG